MERIKWLRVVLVVVYLKILDFQSYLIVVAHFDVAKLQALQV